ncbi:MAG: acyl-CoA thioesterase, partial [Desulfosporosinus sp.]
FFRDRGLSIAELARSGLVFPVVHLEINYRSSALHDDLVRVETAVQEIRKSSFTLAHQVLRVNDGKLLADGKVILACVVKSGMKPQPQRLPEEIIEALKK